MSNAHQKAQKASKAFGIPVVAAPDNIRTWRRLVRVRKCIIGIWLGGIGCEILVFPLMGVFPSIKYQILAAVCALTVCWFSAACVGVIYNLRLEYHIRQSFKSKDITSLGCWIDTLFAPTSTAFFPQTMRQNYEAGRSALLEQLPLLTEETAYLLRADERHALYKTLYGLDTNLIRVVLQVVPVLGDARALPFVQHLAKGKGLAATNTEVLEEAQASLLKLQANLDLSRSAHGLLRASQPPQAPVEELLVPASAHNETEPDELLRADVQE